MSLLYTSFTQRLGVSNPTVAQVSAPVASPNTATTKNDSKLSLADKKEIHNAKAGASFWAGVFGPFKPLWDFLFYNPNKAAKKRLDVKSGQRSELAGEALEADKKKAQLKAALIPCLIRSVTAFTIPLPGLIGAVIAPLSYLFFEKPEAPDFNEKL
ncbi:MAG: hypothetical protein ACK551_01770 [Vampirovibrionales bacterium]